MQTIKWADRFFKYAPILGLLFICYVAGGILTYYRYFPYTILEGIWKPQESADIQVKSKGPKEKIPSSQPSDEEDVDY